VLDPQPYEHAPMTDGSDLLIRYGGPFADGLVESASGSWMTLSDGRRVLDFTAGQICATIGHNHPAVVAAIDRACREVLHLNSWALSRPVLALAEHLLATLPPHLQRAMFLSTGGEGVEAALRLAKLVTGRFEVASLTRSWHGMTAGAGAVTLSGGRRGYGPTLPGAFTLPAPYAYRCPIRHCDGRCDCSCLEAGFELFDQASVGAQAAVIAEPVLSAGGVIVPPPGYFARLAELCDVRGMLVILDECQTGLGRLGTMYGFELYDVVPDFLVLSKTLGGGVPISALVTSPEIEERGFERGFAHITSHVSDPLPAAAADAVLEVVTSEDLPAAARARGDQLLAGLRALQDRHEAIGEVRGAGLLCGVELVEDRDSRAPADALGRALTEECLRCGLSVNLVRGRSAGAANCLRMAPPLTIAAEEVDLALTVLDDALAAVTATAPA
jgi:2,2-dialkylglycine decarboxylase (pyruvate)